MLALVLLFHGLIHLFGVAKAFGFAAIPALQPISRPLGTLWLLAAMLLVCSAVLLLASSSWWWVALAPALIASQAALVTAWGDAKYGTIVNVVLAVPLLLALVNALPSSFPSRFRKEVRARLEVPSAIPVVTEADLVSLPEPVRRYLRRVGVVGKPRVTSLRARFRGQIRAKPDGSWMAFHAEQYNFYEPRARLFLLDSSLFGLPFVALHRYVGAAATMEVKAASIASVVDARGPEMNQSETVTLLNDMCVLAPSTLIDGDLRWEVLDPRSVRATFTNAGHTISSVLVFNDRDELVNFHSDDRYQSVDGKSYTLYRWSTPLRDYRDFGGVTLASHGDASWRMPSGELEYGRFDLLSVEYNVGGDVP